MPYGVETYDAPEREAEVMNTNDMVKMILSGMVIAGIGFLVAGMAASGGILAVAAAAITGVAGAFVNAGVGALVENKSLCCFTYGAIIRDDRRKIWI